MGKSFKLGTVTREDQRKNDRKVRRESDIVNGFNTNKHRVHVSKKTYSRKDFIEELEFSF